MRPSDSAYVAVLENKLDQAERSLYEFRKIFSHWQSTGGEDKRQYRTLTKYPDGRYPGQLPPLDISERGGPDEEVPDPETECSE